MKKLIIFFALYLPFLAYSQTVVQDKAIINQWFSSNGIRINFILKPVF